MILETTSMNSTGGTSSSSSTATINTSDRKVAVDEAAKAADEFYKLFYKTLELRPHRVAQLYLDSAVLIWDGNPYVNQEAIKKFYDGLPPLTFNPSTMDAQPLPAQAVGGQKTFMIATAGSYLISGVGSRTRPFNQTFVITASGDKWKIASDVFRSQMAPN